MEYRVQHVQGLYRPIESCSTEPLNKLLQQLTIDVFIRKIATFSAISIKEFGNCDMKSYRHSDILNQLKINLLYPPRFGFQ